MPRRAVGCGGRLLKLTAPPLAPAIVEAILDGRQGAEVTLPALMAGVERVWEIQTISYGAMDGTP